MTRLLDTVRRKMIFGMVVERCAVAFSQPTQDGLQLARAYVNSSSNSSNSSSSSSSSSSGKAAGQTVQPRKGSTSSTSSSSSSSCSSDGSQAAVPLVYAVVAD
jgi:ESCO1/2 acetyl-transferase